MSDATFSLTGSPQLLAGETVNVYRANAVGATIIDTKTLDARGEATFDGLEWDTEYVARGGRDVRFRTPPDPDDDLATIGDLDARFGHAATVADLVDPSDPDVRPVRLVEDTGDGDMGLYAWDGDGWLPLASGVSDPSFIVVDYDGAFVVGDALVWDGVIFNTEALV